MQTPRGYDENEEEKVLLLRYVMFANVALQLRFLLLHMGFVQKYTPAHYHTRSILANTDDSKSD